MDEQKLTFISKEKLFEMMENREKFTLVEVLSEEDFHEGHLPFAINIPMDKIDELSAQLLPDKNATIVTYCSSFICNASTGAARALQAMGYTHVLEFRGGKKDWADAGLPLIE